MSLISYSKFGAVLESLLTYLSRIFLHHFFLSVSYLMRSSQGYITYTEDSAYLLPFFLSQEDPVQKPEKLNRKLPRDKAQIKLTALSPNSNPKANYSTYKYSVNSKSSSSEDCMIVENNQSYHSYSRPQGASSLVTVEEGERPHSYTKHIHVESVSPRNDNIKCPTVNEEANDDASGNGFVTAKTKLVYCF